MSKETITLTGMVLSASMIGEYDKRLVIMTKEKGKIVAFARGVRRPNSPLMAASQPLVYGQFKVMTGFDAYRLIGAEIEQYFAEVGKDLDAICYGTYFLEFVDYLMLEGNANKEVLKLLYVTMRALSKKQMPFPLIRRVFELRLLSLEGQGLSAFSCIRCGRKENLLYFDVNAGGAICTECVKKIRHPMTMENSTLYAIQYILSAPLTKLYAFQLTDAVFAQVDEIGRQYLLAYIPKKFKSLEILEAMT